MDDHEVQNDYDGQTVDPARYAAGRQAFLENNPIRETGLPHDPSCAGDPLYRTVKWGSEVELFITDQRSCRSADVDGAACGGDLGPTLPPAVRQTFPFSLFLTPSPPPGCLAAINDPSRTMLGPVQKARFKNDLLNSTAKHKIVDQRARVPAVLRAAVRPLGGLRSRAFRDPELHPEQRHRQRRVPDDGQPRHAAEPGVDRQVRGQHSRSRTRRSPARSRRTPSSNEVIAVAGPLGLFVFNQMLNLVNIDCRHLDKYSYGHVDVQRGRRHGDGVVARQHRRSDQRPERADDVLLAGVRPLGLASAGA